MKITLNAHPDNAPCCIEIVAEDGQSRLIQTDWDWPGIASTFGWSVSDVQHDPEDCDHCDHATDGTVKCPKCGMPVSLFLKSAREFIDDNDGKTVEDPGYF